MPYQLCQPSGRNRVRSTGEAESDAFLAGTSGNEGDTFPLTTAIDVVNGTTGNDLIIGTTTAQVSRTRFRAAT
jgi:hypothetical protein